MTTTELQTTGAMEFRITDPVDFIQAIHFNKDELMEAIKARVARYEGVTYTANTIGADILLDDDLIRRGLSPGGSADILALAFLLERWRYYIGD